MPAFDITKTTPEIKSFRTDKLVGMFELKPEHRTQRFTGNIILPDKWSVGVIVGRSGTGKTTIARDVFGFPHMPVYSDQAIIDDMSDFKTVEEITQTFTQVGFSSPPSWLKPYKVLSNGEMMRVDLAHALLSGTNPIIFDEFTSVVDRDVAKVVSHVVQKRVRAEGRQFVAVTCHYDVIDYLEPDWVFDTNTMTMTDVKKKTTLPNSPLTYGDQRLMRSEILHSITI